MLVSLTVGKVDAGVAVLLTEDKRLIEFPSILLPPDIIPGSIVDINVSRNFQSEQVATRRFTALQSEIYQTFGQNSPSAPILRCRNATQTSVVLEWDPISLATAELRSLSLYRNGGKAGNIPRDKLSTKISGLAVDTEYVFHLVLRTSAGTYGSEKLAVRTQKMTDLTGITITAGVMPAPLRDSLAETVQRISAKLIDTVRIDTTHFVCTEGRGQAWEKAVEMNVPVVVPDWVKGCEREGRIVGVRGYYLNADPKLRQVGPGAGLGAGASGGNAGGGGGGISGGAQPPEPQRQASQLRVAPVRDSPRIEHTPPTPEQTNRQRQREQSRLNGGGPASVSEPPTPPPKMEKFPLAPTELDEADEDDEETPAPPAAHQPLADAKPAQADGAEDDSDSDVSVDTEKGGNSLAAIGIPHAAAETKDGAGEREQKGGKEKETEGEGAFDEVDL